MSNITAIRPKIFATESEALAKLFEARKSLLAQLTVNTQEIQKEAGKTPTFAFIKGISGGHVPVGTVDADHIAFELDAYKLDQRLVKTAPSQIPYVKTTADKLAALGEKTINSLLNGKALSPEEKRKLVVAMLPEGILEDSK